MELSRTLFMCFLITELVVVNHAEFSRKYTGVTFSPYVKNADGKGSFPSFESYSADDIKVMLEVVSTKFSRICTENLGSNRDAFHDIPYFDNDVAISKTAEVAARLNNARGNKSLAVYIGIANLDSEDNIESAAETAISMKRTANEIYKGTVEGFVLLPDPSNSESLSSASLMIDELRNYEYELRIGIKLMCDDGIGDDNSRYNRIFQERRDLIEVSDFLVCSVDPGFGDGDVRTYAMSAFTKINKFKKQAEYIKSSIDFMAETYWPSDGNETWLNTHNLRDYWIEIDRLAVQNNIHVWLREAFDNPWRKQKSSYHEHDGWWKLTKNSLARNVAGYVEKVPVHHQDSTAENRALFGEFCNKTSRCNSRASLNCHNGTCQCIKKNEMIYDSSKGQCVVLSGERCTYTTIEILTDQTREKRYSERLRCVENASCNSDGYCGCQSDSFETAEGLCALKKGYLLNCSRNAECQEVDNLICLNGSCLCNATESTYDERYGKCIGKVGAGRKYPACVSHASFLCSDSRPNCNLCQCKSGYIASSDGFCYADYGTSCSSKQSPCLENYMCENGICTCHFPTHQMHKWGHCLSKVNGPCSETIHGKTYTYGCIGEAECINDEGVPECLCKKGYIISSEGVCKKAFGTPCSRDIECDQVPGANLTCREGHCSCGDFKIYDNQLSQCLGLVGAKCDEANSCIPNAFCKEHRDKTMEGSCRCIAGMKVNNLRKCELLNVHAFKNETETEYAAEEDTATEVDANIF